MKQCPQCHQQYADSVNFCANDGSVLNVVEVTQPPSPAPTHASSPIYAPPVTPNQKPVLLYVLLAAIAALLLVAVMFFMRQVSNTNDLKAKQEELVKTAQATKDKEAQDKADKAKAEKEAAATGAVKRSDSAGTKGDLAIVKEPPSNVRETPNGAVMCTLLKKTSINTFGLAGYATNKDGEETAWYYTDACGKMGVIAETQLTF